MDLQLVGICDDSSLERGCQFIFRRTINRLRAAYAPLQVRRRRLSASTTMTLALLRLGADSALSERRYVTLVSARQNVLYPIVAATDTCITAELHHRLLILGDAAPRRDQTASNRARHGLGMSPHDHSTTCLKKASEASRHTRKAVPCSQQLRANRHVRTSFDYLRCRGVQPGQVR